MNGVYQRVVDFDDVDSLSAKYHKEDAESLSDAGNESGGVRVHISSPDHRSRL